MIELPGGPSELLPYKTFRERLKQLGLSPKTVGAGGSDRALFERGTMRLYIVHSGYGGGYGGDRKSVV